MVPGTGLSSTIKSTKTVKKASTQSNSQGRLVHNRGKIESANLAPTELKEEATISLPSKLLEHHDSKAVSILSGTSSRLSNR